ncbi:MAG: hypothetical protein QOC66_717, partial [Pseudonocardiales bacterium]|nr:hypothetical protein [Pseudonocardiales bacterium]
MTAQLKPVASETFEVKNPAT